MHPIRLHRYLPIACTYLFINGIDILPLGLLITSVLSPLLYIWLLLKQRRFVLEAFLAVLCPFAIANAVDGIDWSLYLVSFLLLLTVYVTAYAFAVAVGEIHSWASLLEPLIWINFMLACVGLVVRFTPWYHLMWQELGAVDTGGVILIRFRMFAYEPSYYSLLLAPLALYSYWLVVRRRTLYSVLLFVVTLFPMLMSLSFGVISGMILAVTLVHLLSGKGLARYAWVLTASVAFMLGYLALPAENVIRLRIDNIISGNDASASVRSSGSLSAAYAMAKEKDIWFGVGLGQVKLYGNRFIGWGTGRLTSAFADTLGQFGLAGVSLRILLEILFFFRTRCYREPFRFSLFLLMFIFQFAGSFVTNLAEYVIWALAFLPSLEMFSMERITPATGSSFYPAPKLI